MSIEITEISKDIYTDIHGRREYAFRYIALDENTVVGCADTIEGLLADVVYCCGQAGIDIPADVVVWDQDAQVDG